ncbi:MAG TPA: hypothetical protein VNS22_01990 [Geminicoccus sp.]|uniref:hypothetical protein n=1 Tax=Geminicoccus sp. TaxID=2024832 RepID=UPI002C20D53F|nr:hypothetical protein [Geminicoccus sp.]HWL67134.1 hypothetical protein [Geminicoccus sp.]
MIDLWSRLGGYLAVAGAAVAGVLVAIRSIKQDAREDVENEHAAADAKASRQATDAYLGAGGDPATVRKRLRDPSRPW